MFRTFKRFIVKLFQNRYSRNGIVALKPQHYFRSFKVPPGKLAHFTYKIFRWEEESWFPASYSRIENFNFSTMFVFILFKRVKFVFSSFFISICFYCYFHIDLLFNLAYVIVICNGFEYGSLFGIMLLEQIEVIEKNGRRIVSTLNLNHTSFVMLMLIRLGNISAFSFRK